MSGMAMKKAIELFLKGKAQYLIFPVTWFAEKNEKEIKQKFLQKAGITKSHCFFASVTSTYDEVAQASKILADLNIRSGSVIVVAERYHMRRSLKIFHSFLSEIKFYNVSSESKYSDPDMPPGLANFIQSRQIRFKLVSIAWNILFYVLTPLLVKNESVLSFNKE